MTYARLLHALRAPILIIFILTLAGFYCPALSQDAANPAPAASASEAPAAAAAEPAAKPKREFRGRLPAYYGKVVDDKQRKAIYAVQIEYAPRIDALKAQLAALIAERDAKVDAVLDDRTLSASKGK